MLKLVCTHFSWHGQSMQGELLADGMYLLRLSNGSRTQHLRMLLQRF